LCLRQSSPTLSLLSVLTCLSRQHCPFSFPFSNLPPFISVRLSHSLWHMVITNIGRRLRISTGLPSWALVNSSSTKGVSWRSKATQQLLESLQHDCSILDSIKLRVPQPSEGTLILKGRYEVCIYEEMMRVVSNSEPCSRGTILLQPFSLPTNAKRLEDFDSLLHSQTDGVQERYMI
jgi:hypothetical protein